MRNRAGRLKQAEKIAYILTRLNASPVQLPAATCLDVGCSSGAITNALAPLFARTIGTDYDAVALQHAERSGNRPPRLVCSDAMRLPLSDRSVDIIVCAQVYEHVPDDRYLVAELDRVLKPGGVIFFSGPNKLFPVELHYNLIGVQWLPARLADRYMQLAGCGTQYYERSRTMWSLRRLLKDFVIRDMTLEVLDLRLQQSTPRLRTKLLKRVPHSVWRLLVPFFPNFNWLLYKRDNYESL
jgi:2-polyprenyl-3-methyl-5-hydroxy-6-metoxy-1,4-benzoquinol methylase